MKYMYYFSINYCSFTTLDHTLSSAIETIASNCKIIILIFFLFHRKVTRNYNSEATQSQRHKNHYLKYNFLKKYKYGTYTKDLAILFADNFDEEI